MREEYKTSENVDMDNEDAVRYAAEELGLSFHQYRICAEKSGTSNRKEIEKFIRKNFDIKYGCC